MLALFSHYLAGVLDHLPRARGLGLDTSVRAVRSAARAHARHVEPAALDGLPGRQVTASVLVTAYRARSSVSP